MTCHYISKNRSTARNPTDVITYRYNGNLVYVPATDNYTQALAHAREAFPQLQRLHDASLSLSLTAPGQEHQFVGISARAWPKLLSHMSRFQIIDVHAHPALSVPIPEITITCADADDHASMMDTESGLPPYRGPDVVDEKAPCPSPSMTTLHPGKRNWFLQKLHANAA